MQNIDDRQVVALANFEIEFVVRGRDLQNTCAKLGIDRVVGDNRNFFTRQRPPNLSVDKPRVPFVVR